jgi:hypothetical protein
MVSAALGFAEEPAPKPKPQIRDAATHEDLAAKLRETQAKNPLAELTPEQVANDPTKKNQPVNIVEDSDIISFNGLTTLVPKRAILALPDNLKSRVGKHTAGHRFVVWKDFYQQNRGWITTIEVSRTQAEGRSPLGEDSQERISKSTNLIVATYQGGPISVLPLKEPEKTEGEPANPAQPPP